MTSNFLYPWRLYGFSDDNTPEEIIIRMQADVEDFVETVIEEDPTTIVLEGRKASFLVSHLKTLIEEAGFSLQMLRHNRIDNRFLHGSFPNNERVILLADSIHEGMKMSRSLRYLEEEGVSVSKVFSYLSKKDGVKAVIDSGIVKPEQIVNHHCVENEKEYRKLLGRLQVYFHSRIVPMEPEIPYDSYALEGAISFRETAQVLRQAIVSALGTEVVLRKTPTEGFPRSVWGMNFRIKETSAIHKLMAPDFPSSFDYEIKYLQICIKMRSRRYSSEFTVISDVDITCRFVKQDGDVLCLANKGIVCPAIKNERLNSKAVICSACIGQLVSFRILNQIKQQIVMGFTKRGLKCRQKETYRPLRARN